jgi:hypothetical protein
MALVTTTGDGLFQAHQPFAANAEKPEQFNKARERRFSESSISNPSRHNMPAQPENPESVNHALVGYKKRVDKLFADWQASLPANRFEEDMLEEEQRIELEGESIPIGSSAAILASKKVRERWTEQGIWDDK